MKKLVVMLMVSMFFAILMTGCKTATTTICEFDKDGKKVKQTTTGEFDAIDKITQSTKDKTVIAWSDGWAAYMVVSTATTENPTPTAKMFAGKVAKGLITLHKNQTCLANIAEIIKATKTDLSVSTSGINNNSNNEADNKTGKEESKTKSANAKTEPTPEE